MKNVETFFFFFLFPSLSLCPCAGPSSLRCAPALFSPLPPPPHTMLFGGLEGLPVDLFTEGRRSMKREIVMTPPFFPPSFLSSPYRPSAHTPHQGAGGENVLFRGLFWGKTTSSASFPFFLPFFCSFPPLNSLLRYQAEMGELPFLFTPSLSVSSGLPMRLFAQHDDRLRGVKNQPIIAGNRETGPFFLFLSFFFLSLFSFSLFP